MCSKMQRTVPVAFPSPTVLKPQSGQILCPPSRPSGSYMASCM